MKEIHFFTSYQESLDWACEHNYLIRHYIPSPILIELFDYDECMETLTIVRGKNALGEKYSKVIVCTQMCFLDTEWLEYGYRVFIHDKTGTFEIVLGDKNERTTRHIRLAHNLYKMWSNGAFDNEKKEE